MIDPENLKTIRVNLGLNQIELAKEAFISQSLITKIEARKLKPSYDVMKKIDDAIRRVYEQKGLNDKKAKDVMNNKPITVDIKTSRKEIIFLMKKHGISNIPVIDNNKVIGLYSEKSLLHNEDVKDALVHSCVTVGGNSSVKLVKAMLDYSDIVIVLDYGKVIGVITRSDLI